MSDPKKQKSPYKDHTVEQVMEAEAGNYYIQIGEELFESENGKLAFSKERAEQFFAVIWDGLRELKESSNPQDQEDAERSLLNFRIIPLRFH